MNSLIMYANLSLLIDQFTSILSCPILNFMCVVDKLLVKLKIVDSVRKCGLRPYGYSVPAP